MAHIKLPPLWGTPCPCFSSDSVKEGFLIFVRGLSLLWIKTVKIFWSVYLSWSLDKPGALLPLQFQKPANTGSCFYASRSYFSDVLFWGCQKWLLHTPYNISMINALTSFTSMFWTCASKSKHTLINTPISSSHMAYCMYKKSELDYFRYCSIDTIFFYGSVV